MLLLDLTLPTVAENLALDEALLDQAEAGGAPREILRLWQSPQPAVILGRSSQAEKETHLEACRADGIPVLRRCSGGCAVVIGPGCLMYSVVLSYELRPQLHHLDEAHRFVLSRVQQALGPNVVFEGTSDLTWQGRKFSGNSLRCKRNHLLYHGTVLYGFPVERIGEYLRTPPRAPQYRGGRNHADFVTNVPIDSALLRSSLCRVFHADTPLLDGPRDLIRRLMDERYGRESWHLAGHS